MHTWRNGAPFVEYSPHMTFWEWLERPPHRPTIVLRAGRRSTHESFDRVPLVAVVVLLILGFTGGVVALVGALVIPVRVAAGRPFEVGGVTYRVGSAHYRGGRVVVAMRAIAPVPLVSCPEIGAFQLHEGGQSFEETVRYYDPVTQRWHRIATSGCFSDPDVIQPATLVPPRVETMLQADITRRYDPLIERAGSTTAALLRQQELEELAARAGLDAHLSTVMADSVPPSLQHVWSFWWRVQPPPFWREWTISFRAPFDRRMSLVVQSSGGFHEFGFDRYAVVALRPQRA